MQKSFGVGDPGAFALFKAALASGNPTDFEKPGLLGGTRKLNGPLGSFALTLSGTDSQGFGDPIVPKPPSVSSKEYATELVELYWASLLRDVPFTTTNDGSSISASRAIFCRSSSHCCSSSSTRACTAGVIAST